jgi:hypothetical protein
MAKDKHKQEEVIVSLKVIPQKITQGRHEKMIKI